MDQYPLVSTKQYLEHSRQWLEAIGKNDHLALLFFRMTDRFKRIQQFVEENDLQSEKRTSKPGYLFLMLDSILHNNSIEDRQDLLEHIIVQLNYKNITSKKKSFDEWIGYFNESKIKLVLIIPQAEEYHNSIGHNLMVWLYHLTQEFEPYITMLSFYEVDISHEQYVSMFSDITRFEPKILYYPLYSEKDTTIFINYLEKKWSTHLDISQKKEILEQCGGHFWFVKEAVREIRDTKTWSVESESMLIRMKTIYQQLLPSEKSALQKITTRNHNFASIETHSIEYFTKLNLVDTSINCKIKLLTSYILNKEGRDIQLIVKDGQILLNNVPLFNFLSRKEYRVLKKLLEMENQIVSRDTIAQAIWSEDVKDQYSDWGIDQVMTRLRRRLQQLSISPKILRSIRGKGYSIKL